MQGHQLLHQAVAAGAEVVIWLDVPVTRRQSLHQAFSQTGEHLYTAKVMSDLFAWLDERGVARFAIITVDSVFLLTAEWLGPNREV